MDRMTYVKHPHSWNRGKYPTKYTSRHTFQEVVARLAAYEDTGLEPEEIMVLIAPSNPPLTLEDLRKMDGEPMWIERRDGGVSGWAIFGDMKSPHGVYFGTAIGGLRLPYDEYGKTWLAYRRKPEEESR